MARIIVTHVKGDSKEEKGAKVMQVLHDSVTPELDHGHRGRYELRLLDDNDLSLCVATYDPYTWISFQVMNGD